MPNPTYRVIECVDGKDRIEALAKQMADAGERIVSIAWHPERVELGHGDQPFTVKAGYTVVLER